MLKQVSPSASLGDRKLMLTFRKYGLEHCENSVDKAYHRYGGDRCAACQQANKSRCVPRKPGDPPTTCWLCAKNHVYCSFRGDPPRRRATLPKGGIEPGQSPAPPSAPRPARAAAAKRKRESDAELSGSEGDSDRSRPFNVPSGSSTQPRPALIITPENKAAVAKAWGALTLSVEGQQRRLKNNIPIGPGEVGDLVQAWSQMGKFLGYLSQQQCEWWLQSWIRLIRYRDALRSYAWLLKV